MVAIEEHVRVERDDFPSGRMVSTIYTRFDDAQHVAETLIREPGRRDESYSSGEIPIQRIAPDEMIQRARSVHEHIVRTFMNGATPSLHTTYNSTF